MLVYIFIFFKKMMQKLFLLYLAVFLLSACVSTFNVPSNLTSDYWVAQPYCLGRYQLRIPKNIHETNSDLFYDQDRIRIAEDETLQSSLSLIKDARNEGVDYNEIYVSDKVLVPGKTHFYVTKYGSDWDEELIRYFGNPYFVTLLNQLGSRLYVIYSSFNIASDKSKGPNQLSHLAQQKIKQAEYNFRTSYLERLENRASNLLPTEPGICLNGVFLKDSGKKHLVGNSSIYFDDFNNSVLTVYMGYPYHPRNLPLLKRDILGSASEFIRTTDFTDYRIIRQGTRSLNNVSGSEILLALGEGNYYFIWESDDQQVQIEFTESSGRTKLTEQQMLQGWDSILPTFKRHH